MININFSHCIWIHIWIQIQIHLEGEADAGSESSFDPLLTHITEFNFQPEAFCLHYWYVNENEFQEKARQVVVREVGIAGRFSSPDPQPQSRQHRLQGRHITNIYDVCRIMTFIVCYDVCRLMTCVAL